jgi:hypothetical protein
MATQRRGRGAIISSASPSRLPCPRMNDLFDKADKTYPVTLDVHDATVKLAEFRIGVNCRDSGSSRKGFPINWNVIGPKYSAGTQSALLHLKDRPRPKLKFNRERQGSDQLVGVSAGHAVTNTRNHACTSHSMSTRQSKSFNGNCRPQPCQYFCPCLKTNRRHPPGCRWRSCCRRPRARGAGV